MTNSIINNLYCVKPINLFSFNKNINPLTITKVRENWINNEEKSDAEA